MNILIPNVGRRGYLVDYIKQLPDFNGKVYVSDCDKTASGLYGNNDGHFVLSRPVDDENAYIQQLKDLCAKYDIKLIIPVIDPEIFILSAAKDQFEPNTTILVSDRDVLDICYNKLNMNEFLKKHGLNVPLTYDNMEDFNKAMAAGEINFPVIVKPIYGSGSVETQVIHDMESLNAFFHEGLIIQEFLEGAIEYGSDLFNTLDKKTVRCVIKRKISMRSGETDKSITVNNSELSELLQFVAEKLGHIGNLDCDTMVKDGKAYVIDLNPRFGGGYPMTHAAGVNLLDIIIRMVNGEDIEPEFNNYPDGLLVMKTINVVSTLVK